MVSCTAGPLSCPEFGGSRSGEPWCSLALPSASAACGLDFPLAAAPAESTSPCRLSWRSMQEIDSLSLFRYQNQQYWQSMLKHKRTLRMVVVNLFTVNAENKYTGTYKSGHTTTPKLGKLEHIVFIHSRQELGSDSTVSSKYFHYYVKDAWWLGFMKARGFICVLSPIF